MVKCAVIVAVGSIAHRSQLTYNRPRAMLPALGKPMVVRMMDRLLNAGIQQYIVILGENEGAVAAYLSHYWQRRASIEFVIQPPSTGLTEVLTPLAARFPEGFMLAAYNAFAHPNFIDRLLKFNEEKRDALILSGSALPMSTADNRYFAFASGREVREVAYLPSNAQPGALALNSLALCGTQFVQFLRSQPYGIDRREVMDIVQAYIHSGYPTYAVEAGWTLQLETDYDLLTLNRQLLDEEQDAHILSELPRSVQIIPPVRIDPQVSVGQNAIIGPRAYLESGASVGANSVLRNAIVLQKAVIPAGELIENAIVSSRAHLQF